jgi:maltose O-acetyltransferase
MELNFVRVVLLPRLRLANLLSSLLPTFSLSSLRAAIYRRAGFKIAPGVAFLGRVTILGSGPTLYERLSIGSGSTIAADPLFVLDDHITIGRNVSIGPDVAIYTGIHLLGPGSRRMTGNVIGRPVVIEDGAWVGAGALVLPGVVIGQGSVVSAGAVVTESVAPNTLVAGNPAKSVMELPWGDL